MEGVELWGSRLFSSGKQSSSSSSSSSCSSLSSSSAMKSSSLCSGGEEYAWEYFPCPFCYIDVEVPVLCSHLQEEHCFDTTNAVCPLCAANGGKDMIGHFSVYHSHMLKRRKPQKTSLQPATAENEPHEVNSYYGTLFTNRRRIAPTPDPVTDPLLSSFICNLPFVDAKDEAKESNSNNIASAKLMFPHEQSSVTSTCNEVITEDYEEMSCRAEFVQQLIFSTMIWS